MDWNYYNTFITVSPDCPAEFGTVPPDKKDGRTKPGLEYELAAGHPYGYTQEEMLYEVHVRHKGYSPEVLAEKGEEIRAEFFSKPKACFRASMLPKKYGWGVHFNEEGKMALVPMESEAYHRFASNEEGKLKVVPGMRSSKK
ncbi:DUF6157 family protein [Paenibacillus arenilitoris]|uniref:Uncharacterized protein n=1 Tax=Paenibacillus arenilitoris TaxID=2772299 RepID=A0A927H7H0_9BACL|nr:DUF6157 family protein [Paenibacillus arenilitoris]MBD2870648.1 hypothetical protein [Paenibacillus arenilitoris]